MEFFHPRNYIIHVFLSFHFFFFFCNYSLYARFLVIYLFTTSYSTFINSLYLGWRTIAFGTFNSFSRLYKYNKYTRTYLFVLYNPLNTWNAQQVTPVLPVALNHRFYISQEAFLLFVRRILNTYSSLLNIFFYCLLSLFSSSHPLCCLSLILYVLCFASTNFLYPFFFKS